MPRGRPPLPIDDRKHGRSTPAHQRDGRLRPQAASVAISPAAEEVPPPPPADLGATGHAFWEQIWSSCGSISAAADYAVVAETAELSDTLEIARCRATRTGDPSDRRVVLAISRELSSALASLGFNPQARTMLGVGLSAPRRGS
jgi:hypothetical protein